MVVFLGGIDLTGYYLGGGLTIDSREDLEVLKSIINGSEQDGHKMNQLYREHKMNIAKMKLATEGIKNDVNFFNTAKLDDVIDRLNKLYVTPNYRDGFEDNTDFLAMLENRFGKAESLIDTSSNRTGTYYRGVNIEGFIICYVYNKWDKYPADKISNLKIYNS